MRYAAISVLAALASLVASAAPVRVTPKGTDELLANPGMGWQTFHQFADGDKQLKGLPSSSAYFRFYWSELEPEEGKIDFAMLDGLIARAAKAGQRLAMRVMCVGSGKETMYVPRWLRDAGCKGFEYRMKGSERVYWTPDFADPLFQKAHFRLIEELGKRYDGRLDLLDIGSVGLWGEWHMSGTGVPMPDEAIRRKIIDAWCAAFPNTPRVMLIGDEPGMRHAIAKGCGFRADCLGDMGGFSKNWNHMKNLYPQMIEKTGAGDAWKVAPVAYESCWDMRKWVAEGWDVRGIFDYALATHASYLNNKSAPIPEGTRPEVERFLKKLGYRLVLTELSHEPVVSAGAETMISMKWENVGVAPPYRDYLLAFRLTRDGNFSVVVTKESARGWLPGERTVSTGLRLPEDLAAGRYELAVGLVEPGGERPMIRLAIQGRGADGWYPVSTIEVK